MDHDAFIVVVMFAENLGQGVGQACLKPLVQISPQTIIRLEICIYTCPVGRPPLQEADDYS